MPSTEPKPDTEPKKRPATTKKVKVHNLETFSTPSIVAAVCAAVSFYGGPIFGVILAAAAIVLGTIGAGRALEPDTRGGILSLAAVGVGLLSIFLAASKLLALYVQ